ncbi:hypothetical protein PpBr36_01960 [Pyricularia pennisetigena]|uniref:hypothetical protein n=1 Tax=Pyricularia pennisetigena TaxID=1578925 RepID=UPI00114D79E1|nr:hypothetical protein PpBr36_01960 [Pyricularia pennisetigena]TLS28376.1 hypothetical protein PpBr36_01960 [Pyricularia pennisetigena]
MLVTLMAAIAATFNALYRPKTAKARRHRRQDRSRKPQALAWQPWSRPQQPAGDLESGGRVRVGPRPVDSRSPPPYDAQKPPRWQHIRRWQLGVASDTETAAVDDANRDGVRLTPVPPARLSGPRGWSSV